MEITQNMKIYKDSNCSCCDRSEEAGMPKKGLIRVEKGAYEKLTESHNRNHISFVSMQSKLDPTSMNTVDSKRS